MGTSKKQKKRDGLRYREFVLSPYGVIKIKSVGYIVPGMSDIYPADDLLLANNKMGVHLRETILSLPGSQWEKQAYLDLIAQLDDEGFDDFTRVRELLGLATGKDNGWLTLRIGELKAMLALAGGDLEQALIWAEWTQDFNGSVFSPSHSNYYRCLQMHWSSKSGHFFLSHLFITHRRQIPLSGMMPV